MSRQKLGKCRWWWRAEEACEMKRSPFITNRKVGIKPRCLIKRRHKTFQQWDHYQMISQLETETSNVTKTMHFFLQSMKTKPQFHFIWRFVSLFSLNVGLLRSQQLCGGVEPTTFLGWVPADSRLSAGDHPAQRLFWHQKDLSSGSHAACCAVDISWSCWTSETFSFGSSDSF